MISGNHDPLLAGSVWDRPPWNQSETQRVRLLREGVQYYHRYISFWHLERYELCARDTNRNLRLFAFVREHARHTRDKLQFDQWRPYVTMMHARAVATPLIGLRESPHFGLNIVVKRAMDVVLSLFALLVLSPLLALVAVLVKITSPGNAHSMVRYYFNATGRPQKKHFIGAQRGYHGSSTTGSGLTALPLFHRHFDVPTTSDGGQAKGSTIC